MLKKTSLSLLFILFAILLPAVTSHAAGGQTQLAVNCMIETRPVAHAKIELYRIGDVVDSTLVPAAPFSELDLPAVQASAAQAEIAAAAAALQTYIEEHQLSPAAVEYTDAQGKALFDSVEIGTYLVLADFSESDAKNASALPALVFVLPGQGDATEVFLKIELPPEETTVPPVPTEPNTPTGPTRPHTPTEPTSPEHPGEPTTNQPPEERLPYTGQLWWPVFALAAAGVLCFAFGFAARRKKQESGR